MCDVWSLQYIQYKQRSRFHKLSVNVHHNGVVLCVRSCGNVPCLHHTHPLFLQDAANGTSDATANNSTPHNQGGEASIVERLRSLGHNIDELLAGKPSTSKVCFINHTDREGSSIDMDVC